MGKQYKQLEVVDKCKVGATTVEKSKIAATRDWRLLYAVATSSLLLVSGTLLWIVHPELPVGVDVTNQLSVKGNQALGAVQLSNMTISRVVSCYYNFPTQDDAVQLMPSGIHPHLCTHINVGFASVVNKEIKLEAHQYETLPNLVKLKLQNPNLKILLSVGGAHGDTGFPDMVVNHASRKTFIRSIKDILRNHSLDGVDLDWEFPALHGTRAGGRERQHFSQLLREIRMEFIREKRDYLLTMAAAAPETIVDVSYDVDQINRYVDFVNIMTYDFHYYSKYTPFTGLNSPLYPRAGEGMYLATLNINYTVHAYRSKGLDADKTVVGIPTYGHTFTLVNADNRQVGSPASGFGSLGSLGFVDYPDACAFVRGPGAATVRRDAAARVPYAYRGAQWTSYDDPRSVAAKADFIKRAGLRGAMLYSLNADDYAGRCAPGAGFPLVRAVSDALRAGGGGVPVSSGTRT